MRCYRFRPTIPFFLLCSIAAFFCWPVDQLVVSLQGTPFLRRSVPPGQRLVFRSIHSVQKTPLEDELVVSGGRLWGWEERTQSHNAGLPTEAPRNGTFLMVPPWMHIRGGRRVFVPLRYRVGTDALGVNRLRIPPEGERDLYRLCPGQLLTFQVHRGPLGICWIPSPPRRTEIAREGVGWRRVQPGETLHGVRGTACAPHETEG